MRRFSELLYLFLILNVSWGFTLGLTWAPCYASLCSKDFSPATLAFMLLAFTLSLPAQDVLSFSVLIALFATRSATITSRAFKCLFCERGSVWAVGRLPSGALAYHWRLQVSGLGLADHFASLGGCADQLSSHWNHRPSCRYSTGLGPDSGRSEQCSGTSV